MKGFIVNTTWRFVKGKACVLLFGRLYNGESFMTINKYQHYFYVDAKKAEKEKSIEVFNHYKDKAVTIECSYEETDFKSKDNQKLIKIITKNPAHVKLLMNYYHTKKIRTYEGDISFDRRFLIDKKIGSIVDIKGNFKIGENIGRIYEEPVLEEGEEYKPAPKIFYFDIETDPQASRVLSIAIECGDFKKTLIVHDKRWKAAISYKTEKDMLVAFREKILKLDPDIMINHYVTDFDLKVLRDRYDSLNIPFEFGRLPGRNWIKIINVWNKPSLASISGRVVLDSINLLKIYDIKLPSYSLQVAAKFILKEKKLIKTHERAEEIFRLYKEDTQRFIDYNMNDVQLVRKILEAKNLLELSWEMSLLTGLTPDKTKGKIASFDNIYQKHLLDKKIASPSVKYVEITENLIGGHVEESTPGMYECVVVFDYTSLYPTVIRTFGIDPLTYMEKSPSKLDNKKFVKTPDGTVFRNVDKTILGDLIIRPLLEKRLKVKGKDKIKSDAIKRLLNGMTFGIFANRHFRWHSMKIANAITYPGREIGHIVQKEIEKFCKKVLGLRKAVVFYRDTDSYYLDMGAINFEKAKKYGKKIEKHINAFLDKYIKDNYNRPNFLHLNYEETAKAFFMPKGKGKKEKDDKSGVKKKYCGLYEKDGKEILKFTGMEYVHVDVPEFIKDFQYNLYWKIFHKQPYNKFIHEFILDLRNGKFDDKLIYTKNMTKKEEDYIKITPPHVKAARYLKEKGSEIPSEIQYVITIDGPRPVEFIDQPYDYDHYIQKMIKPVVEEAFEFLGDNFKEFVKDKKQKGLKDY